MKCDYSTCDTVGVDTIDEAVDANKVLDELAEADMLSYARSGILSEEDDVIDWGTSSDSDCE